VPKIAERRAMPRDLQAVFTRLRAVLQKHAAGASVSADTNARYCLEGDVGPATLQAWGGRIRRKQIPVAWVEVGKTAVSFHIMALGDSSLHAGMSDALRARMQGKTCFNFVTENEALFAELDGVTTRALTVFRKAGFVS
jgi:hypothetical protein